MERSSLLFSGNTTREMGLEVEKALGIKEVQDLYKIPRGFQQFWGRSKCEPLAFLHDRIQQKLHGWCRWEKKGVNKIGCICNT